jgi:Big-like domain-containing protein
VRGFSSIVLAASLIFFTGCGSETEPDPDTTPPGIESTTPSDNQTGVAADSDIVIQFDEAIDRNSINSDIFHLSQNGTPLYGNVSYDLALHKANLSIPMDLQAGLTYQAVLEAGVKDMTGNRVTEAYQWSFTIAN